MLYKVNGTVIVCVVFDVVNLQKMFISICLYALWFALFILLISLNYYTLSSVYPFYYFFDVIGKMRIHQFLLKHKAFAYLWFILSYYWNCSTVFSMCIRAHVPWTKKINKVLLWLIVLFSVLLVHYFFCYVVKSCKW